MYGPVIHFVIIQLFLCQPWNRVLSIEDIDGHSAMAISLLFLSFVSDVDECLPNPCPSMSTCTHVQGSFQCICPLGYQMEKGKCNLGKSQGAK